MKNQNAILKVYIPDLSGNPVPEWMYQTGHKIGRPSSKPPNSAGLRAEVSAQRKGAMHVLCNAAALRAGAYACMGSTVINELAQVATRVGVRLGGA